MSGYAALHFGALWAAMGRLLGRVMPGINFDLCIQCMHMYVFIYAYTAYTKNKITFCSPRDWHLSEKWGPD